MKNKSTRDEVLSLVVKIPYASGPYLLEVASELARIAESEIKTAKDQDELAKFYDMWFGNDPGYFWIMWEKISRGDKANFIWSKEPLRRLLLLPVEQILQ